MARTGLDKWLYRLIRVVQRTFADEVAEHAAAMTYYILFAVFPLAFCISMLLGILHLPILSVYDDIGRFLPADVVTLINTFLLQMQESSSTSLLTVGVIFTLYFPLRAVNHMMDVMSLIYMGEEMRGRKKVRNLILLTVFLIILIPAQLLFTLLGSNVLTELAENFPSAAATIQYLRRIRFLPIGVSVVLFLLGVHKLSVPHKIRLKQLFPGAFLSGAAWFLYSIAFSYYVDHIANYSLIYGSFATVVVALIWLNISLMTLLIGAEYNRVLMEEKGETLI